LSGRFLAKVAQTTKTANRVSARRMICTIDQATYRLTGWTRMTCMNGGAVSPIVRAPQITRQRRPEVADR
jgi:hypothetical protein